MFRSSFRSSFLDIFVNCNWVIKWKQPVAYYLIHRSTKEEVLLNFLMEVFDASHNVALQVVATVFYRGANNQDNETVGFF